jgi:hypothetical protein
MQTAIQRTLWVSIWASTMAITFLLCADMAKDQPILLAIIVLAAIVQSVALVYARIHWRDSNKTSAAAALFVGVLCLGVSIVSEVSYWSSTIEGVHHQIQREKSLAGGQDIVKERRRVQLAQSVGGKLPGQIESEIATAPARDIPALRAQLKAARELQGLEGQVIADSTQVVNFSIKRSFYEAAALGSENMGGDIRAWILGIVTLIVACMLSLHLLSLYIGFAPTRRVEAATALKPLTLPEVAEKVAPPASKPLALSDTALNRIVSELPPPNLALKALFPEDDGPKGGGGKKLILPSSEVGQQAKEAPTAEPQKTATAAFFEDEGNVVDLLTPKQRRDLAHGGRKKKDGKRTEGNVTDWLASCTSQTPDKRVKATSQDCRKSYMAWCSINRLQPVGHKQMSRIISVEIYRGNDGARGPRNGKGAVFPGLLVAMPVAEQLRKRA